MISFPSEYDRLKEREASAIRELEAIREELSSRYTEREVESVWQHVSEMLRELPGQRQAPVTIEIDGHLVLWLRQRAEESGEDEETFVNALLIEDYLFASMRS